MSWVLQQDPCGGDLAHDCISISKLEGRHTCNARWRKGRNIGSATDTILRYGVQLFGSDKNDIPWPFPQGAVVGNNVTC